MKRDSRGPGRGVAAGVEGDATIKASEATELRLPASIVAGEFVHENDGRACAGFFVEEVDAVRCGRVCHIRDYNGSQRTVASSAIDAQLVAAAEMN